MNKRVTKEIIIALLMAIVILLVLGILLYNFMPNNKTLPEGVSYVTSEKVTQALIASGGIDDSQVILTYELDSTDLNNYENVKNYTPGKTNPFSSGTKGTDGESNTTNQSNDSTESNTTNGNSNSNTNTTNNESNTSSGYSKQTDGK